MPGGTATVSRERPAAGAECTGGYGVGVTLLADETPTRDELLDLYGSVGWTVYTRDPERL